MDDDGRKGSPRWVLVCLVVVVALSAAVRIVDLPRFRDPVFDEHYHVHDARVILRGDYGPSPGESWKPADVRSAAHPDLGKLAIAAGILVLGDDPWGWRLPSALAGTLLVALAFPIARRFGLDPAWSLAATLFCAADTLLIAESRLGVLDIFVSLWTAVAVYCALRSVQSRWSPRWLLLCGVAVGLAVASKWSGVLTIPAVVAVLLSGWRRAGRPRPLRLATLAAVALVIVPSLVYLGSALPYFLAGHSPADWARLQAHMLTFGWRAEGATTFASRPVTWIFDVHPIWYRWVLTDRGTIGLLAIGNPLLWWAGAIAFVVLAVQAVTRRSVALGVVPAVVACLYLPWLFTSREAYIYYMAPTVVFLATLVALALSRLEARPFRGWPALLAFAAGVALTAAAYAVIGAVAWVVRSAGGVALAALVVSVAAAVIALLWAARRRGTTARVRGILAWGYAGAVAGVPLALLPFLIGWPVAFEYYHRLMLFTTWR